MSLEKIIAFAKENGYETAEKLKPWNGYEVYEPIMDKDNFSYIGPPLVILVQGNTIRMSTVEEAFQRLDDLPEYEDTENT